MATHATNEVDHLRGIVRAKGLDYLGDDWRAGDDLRGFASEHEGLGVVFHSVPTCLTRMMLFTTFYWFLRATYCHFAGDEGPLTSGGARVFVWPGVFQCPVIVVIACPMGSFHGGMSSSVARPLPNAPPCSCRFVWHPIAREIAACRTAFLFGLSKERLCSQPCCISAKHRVVSPSKKLGAPLIFTGGDCASRSRAMFPPEAWRRAERMGGLTGGQRHASGWDVVLSVVLPGTDFGEYGRAGRKMPRRNEAAACSMPRRGD